MARQRCDVCGRNRLLKGCISVKHAGKNIWQNLGKVVTIATLTGVRAICSMPYNPDWRTSMGGLLTTR